ncbi:unnamed protein product [Cochlearia groenlandica]
MIYFSRKSDHYSIMSTKTLEMDIRSAEGLKVNRRPVKRKTFAVVSIGEKSGKTDLDGLGGSEPRWNYKLEMPMDTSCEHFIIIEVFYPTGCGHNKKIGQAKIPSTDFMGTYSTPQGHSNFLSYRLRDDFGDKCGLVNVSIMVQIDPNEPCMSSQAEPPSIDGYGVGVGPRVVTGVPVWCLIQRPT